MWQKTIPYAIAIIMLMVIVSIAISNAETIDEPRDEKERTPLMVALRSKADMVEIISLLDRGADINARNINGFTPLMYAAFHHHETVAELLKRGADIHAKDVWGRTALFFAASSSKTALQILLDAGADPNSQDVDGKTALMEVLNIYHKDLPYEEILQLRKEHIQLLIDYGADISLKDKEGHNISDNAIFKYYNNADNLGGTNDEEDSYQTDEEIAEIKADIEKHRLFTEYIKQLYEKHTGTVLPPFPPF